LRAPRVVIFIREPEARPAIDQIALIETFGLTRRESEIACRLAEGMGVDAIATHFRIKPGTVRHNLKSVFEKTEARSQAALVALVRGFAC
jgi:DNA-binding CsgD family transcriptional regulator